MLLSHLRNCSTVCHYLYLDLLHTGQNLIGGTTGIRIRMFSNIVCCSRRENEYLWSKGLKNLQLILSALERCQSESTDRIQNILDLRKLRPTLYKISRGESEKGLSASLLINT